MQNTKQQNPILSSDESFNSDYSFVSSDDIDKPDKSNKRAEQFKESMNLFFKNNPDFKDNIQIDEKEDYQTKNNLYWQSIGHSILKKKDDQNELSNISSINEKINIFKNECNKISVFDILQAESNQTENFNFKRSNFMSQIQKNQQKMQDQAEKALRLQSGDVKFISDRLKKTQELKLKKIQQLQKFQQKSSQGNFQTLQKQQHYSSQSNFQNLQKSQSVKQDLSNKKQSVFRQSYQTQRFTVNNNHFRGSIQSNMCQSVKGDLKIKVDVMPKKKSNQFDKLYSSNQFDTSNIYETNQQQSKYTSQDCDTLYKILNKTQGDQNNLKKQALQFYSSYKLKFAENNEFNQKYKRQIDYFEMLDDKCQKMYFPNSKISDQITQQDIENIFEDPNLVYPEEENLFFIKRVQKVMNSNLMKYWKKRKD